VKAIDLAGMGGTSFSAVELYRARNANDGIRARVGETFFDWGIPTPVSLISADKRIPMIASGGVRTGLDVARAISLGAVCAGAANLVLEEATQSADAVRDKLITIREELKAAMLLTGSPDIKALSGARHVVLGETEKWIRGM
jgi:isopentenyl-diphosphate delta-isomerase